MGVVTTIHTLKGNIQDALDYVLDREKSESHLMSCSNSASPFLAGKKWKVLNEIRSKSEMQEDSTVGYHFIQSFDDKNVTPEKCYELARQWIEKCTKGKYDYVISVHKNTDHVHAHIIVNPINNETGKSWHLYYKRDLKKFRTYSDEICKSYGLEINENKKGISNSWYKHHQIKQGDSNDQMIMKSLDYLCDKVKDYEQLKQCLTVLGYKVEDGFNQTNESLYEDYEFTLNKKMIDTNLTDEFSYFVRIPYTQEYIQIPKEKGQWDEKEQTLKCHMNFNEKHIIYDLKGNIVDEERDGVFIAEHLEDKKIKGRKGLQIKTPFMKKPRRCKFLSNEYADGILFFEKYN